MIRVLAMPSRKVASTGLPYTTASMKCTTPSGTNLWIGLSDTAATSATLRSQGPAIGPCNSRNNARAAPAACLTRAAAYKGWLARN